MTWLSLSNVVRQSRPLGSVAPEEATGAATHAMDGVDGVVGSVAAAFTHARDGLQHMPGMGSTSGSGLVGAVMDGASEVVHTVIDEARRETFRPPAFRSGVRRKLSTTRAEIRKARRTNPSLRSSTTGTPTTRCSRGKKAAPIAAPCTSSSGQLRRILVPGML